MVDADTDYPRKQLLKLPPTAQGRPDLSLAPFPTISLTNPPRVKDLIAAYIARETELCIPKPEVVERGLTRINPHIRVRTLDIFDRGVVDPSLLRGRVDRAGFNLAGYHYMRHLCDHFNRSFQYREQVGDSEIAQQLTDEYRWPYQSVHKLLSAIVLAHAGDLPATLEHAHQTLVRFYGEFQSHDRINLNLHPATVEVPFLKTDDRGMITGVERAVYLFPRERMVCLAGLHTNILVVGSPNAGKTSFTHKLLKHMGLVVSNLVNNGVLGKGDLRVVGMTADPSSNAWEALSQGQRRVNPKDKQPWSQELVQQTVDNLAKSKQAHQITVSDAAGLVAGRVNLDQILEAADYVIHVERFFESASERWDKKLAEVGMPCELAAVQTPFRAPGILSGVHRFESRVLGYGQDYITGVVPDLARVAEYGTRIDLTMLVIAHFIMGYALPEKVLAPRRSLADLASGFNWRYKRQSD